MIRATQPVGHELENSQKSVVQAVLNPRLPPKKIHETQCTYTSLSKFSDEMGRRVLTTLYMYLFLNYLAAPQEINNMVQISSLHSQCLLFRLSYLTSINVLLLVVALCVKLENTCDVMCESCW